MGIRCSLPCITFLFKSKCISFYEKKEKKKKNIYGTRVYNLLEHKDEIVESKLFCIVALKEREENDL